MGSEDAARNLRRLPRSTVGSRRRRFSVSLSEEEYVLLEQRARNYGVSMSRVLVNGALHAARAEAIDGASLEAAFSILADMQNQVRGIATNLNQLTHHANKTQNFPEDAALVAKRAKRLMMDIEELLEGVSA